jgi:superfamily II DNA or RNA helicase
MAARPAGPDLRGYQQDVVDRLRASYRAGSRAPLLVLPTGGGKTVVFAHIAAAAAAKGKRVLVLVHRRELLRQASEKLAAAGVLHGVVLPGRPIPDAPVLVASVQLLGRRLDELRQLSPDLVIIDEAHHAIAAQWRAVLDSWPMARLLGVTATPLRGDGAGLGVKVGGVFDDLILGPSIAALTRGGHLVRARVFAPTAAPDLHGVRTRAGDYETGALTDVMCTSEVVGCAIEHYQRLAPGVPAVLFAASVKHAEAMADAFRAAGVRAIAVSGSTPASDRDVAVAGLASGDVQVLCTCDLVSEGLDVPSLGAVILLRPTKSAALYLQQVGRGLRPAPGKDALLALDHAGNTFAHGLPDAPRRWTLEGETTEEKRRRLRIAAQGDGRGGEAAREVVQGDGELREVTPEDQALIQVMRTAPLHRLVREAQSYDDLVVIGRVRGYNSRWAGHAWRERQEAISQ